ncbi:alpha/beta-hydrolase [Trichoderma citrinoviride]|uniref:Alpha/beta-hydrolase n=1 Tax=Trichoderma citrinoviride TaxID=58853 RepID=A0A2T4BBS0_9HYPO|nr:alpha/beta-hydrolase [Trichoderma citrinoviride]PTB66639.1 alpha/beta-hydrolase [Trichoderma citrinoviride]
MAELTTGVHKFNAPDIELTYTVRGSGPYLVVQAAGWGISSQYLQIGLSPLENRFTMIYPEPRGSGSSARPQQVEMMSTSDMADDIEHLRKYLGQETIDLLGHSNGGTIALAYAQRYPNSVRNLVLVTHWLDGYDDSRVWQQFVEDRKNNPAFAKAVEALEEAKTKTFKSQDEWFQSLRVRLSFYPADPEQHYAIFEKAMGVPSWWVYESQLAADKLKPLDLYAALHTVKARTLCLGCSDDPICSENVSRITAERIPESQLVVIPHCGHFPWIEKPDEFFEAITTFLK